MKEQKLEEIVNPFETPKEEEKSDFNLLKYRIPYSMVYGGIYSAVCFSAASMLDIVKGKREDFPSALWVAGVFFAGTITIYGTGLIRDGIRKLRNKDYQPFSWFL
jgi:hypothetical protein